MLTFHLTFIWRHINDLKGYVFMRMLWKVDIASQYTTLKFPAFSDYSFEVHKFLKFLLCCLHICLFHIKQLLGCRCATILMVPISLENVNFSLKQTQIETGNCKFRTLNLCNQLYFDSLTNLCFTVCLLFVALLYTFTSLYT